MDLKFQNDLDSENSVMKERQDSFIDLSIKHGEAIQDGNHKQANKVHAKLTSLYNEIRKNGTWYDLENLVKHPNENVKMWAATFLLRHDEDLARSVLNELKTSEGIIGLEASTTIDLWKKNMLDLL